MRHNPQAKAHQPLNAVQQELVVQWHKFAMQQVNKFIKLKNLRKDNPARDDIYSCAHLALIKAAQAFDPARNRSFGTYLGRILATDLPKALAAFLSNRLRTLSDQQDFYESFTARDEHESWDEGRWQQIKSAIDRNDCRLAAEVAELHNRFYLSEREIAAQLNMTIGQVKACLSGLRGNQKLSREMAAVLS